MTITAKLFTSGRNRAIRLPAKLRLDAKEGRIEQIGIALRVLPQPPMGQDMTELVGQLLWIERMPARELPVRSGQCSASTARLVLMRRTRDTGRQHLQRHPPTHTGAGGCGFPCARAGADLAVRDRGAGASDPLQLASYPFATPVETRLTRFDVRPWPVEACACARCAGAGDNVIGTMDSMIAAHSMTEDSVVVINSSRDFLRVPALAVEEWSH